MVAEVQAGLRDIVVSAHNPFADFEFGDLPEITDEELGASFDELSAIAAEQPDNKLALEALRGVVRFAYESGRVEAVMQMAMTLGAMTCTHNHMKGIANESGSMLFGDAEQQSDDHAHDHADEDMHDSKTCKDCKAGKCRKK